MKSGHCFAQQRWGAMWKGRRDTASTPLTFVMTQLCQPRLSAHLSWCWFLLGPEDLGRWLPVLHYLSSQVVGTRGLTALLVIPQSRAQTHSQRGEQGITPSHVAASSPGLRERRSNSTAGALISLQEECGEKPWKPKLSLIICRVPLAESKLLL